MKVILSLIILLTLSALPSHAQYTHQSSLFRRLGNGGEDLPTDVIGTKKGYILSATVFNNGNEVTDNHGANDMWACMLDSTGKKILWAHCYGGAYPDIVGHMIATPDGNFLLAGTTYSSNGTVTNNFGVEDGWLVKIDTNGNVIWQRNYGGSAPDDIYAVTATPDSGFVFAGETKSSDHGLTNHNTNNTNDAFVGKVDKNGNLLWQRSIGSSGSDFAKSITTLNDGNVVVAIITRLADGDIPSVTGMADICYMGLNQATGSTMWTTMIGSTKNDDIQSLTRLSDGSIVSTVTNGASDGDFKGAPGSEALLVRMSSSGTVQKLVQYPKAAQIGAVSETPDGGLLLLATTTQNVGNPLLHFGNNNTTDLWVIKTNINDLVQWQGVYGGSGNEDAACIIASSDSTCVVLAASTSKDYNLFKTIARGQRDTWIFSLPLDSAYSAGVTDIARHEDDVKIYPTLSHGSTNIEFANTHKYIQFAVTNMAGQPVNTIVSKVSDNHYSITDLPVGMYIIQVKYDGYTATSKVMVE